MDQKSVCFRKKIEKRPITSSSMTFSSSLSRRDSNGEVEMFRPGRPGFSGTKLKLNQRSMGPYVLSGGPLIFNVILFKRKAVYTEGAGPVCKCTGQCTLEGCILLF